MIDRLPPAPRRGTHNSCVMRMAGEDGASTEQGYLRFTAGPKIALAPARSMTLLPDKFTEPVPWRATPAKRHDPNDLTLRPGCRRKLAGSQQQQEEQTWQA